MTESVQFQSLTEGFQKAAQRTVNDFDEVIFSAQEEDSRKFEKPKDFLVHPGFVTKLGHHVLFAKDLK